MDWMKWFDRHSLYLAWVVSLLGLVISLYFGELERVEPCRLCWYQRIALFPLAIILGIAAYRNDRGIVVYAMPLAVIGALLALYHVLGQWFPSLLSPASCGYSANCSKAVFSLFGFLTFPMLSALGFILLIFLLSRLYRDTMRTEL